LLLNVGDIIQLNAQNAWGDSPPDRYLIVSDVDKFNISNKSKFTAWDTKEHWFARVSVKQSTWYADQLFSLKPEFNRVKYVGLIMHSSQLGNPNRTDLVRFWHDIILKKAEDE